MDGYIKKWKGLGARFDVVRGLNMQEKTTMGVGGACEYALLPKDTRSLAVMAADGFTVLGACSNVIVGDGGANAFVFTGNLCGVRVEGTDVFAECGVSLPRLARLTADYGLTGLEPLSGVPGTVGGAVKMNAGCFGTEIGRLVRSVVIAGPDGIKEVDGLEMDFSYRYSRVDELGTVLKVRLGLSKGSPDASRSMIAEYAKQRRERFPQGKSAGCYFRRVDGISSGYFIEKAGLKGLKIGGAAVSDKHAAFIVNLGGATAYDVRTLADIVKEEVRRTSGIVLQEEVEYYGKF